ncbi:MAG TPA: efflux RND transporter permease subunit [Ignavibacteria bacterium]
MKLTEVAIKRPAFMTMIFVALAVLGLYGYLQMGVDLLPKMDWPMVFVSTVYPGAGPEEVETQITKPIEESLSSLSGLKSLRAYSGENVAFFVIEFEMSVDVNVALNEVERKINEVKTTLPEDAKDPQVFKIDLNTAPILRVASTSNMETIDFYQLLKDKIKPKIEQTDGVAMVSLVGGKEREIRIEVDNDKLKSYNLSILQVTQILKAENLDFPTGKVEQKEKNYIVRVAGKLKGIDEVKNIILSTSQNGTVRLKDVASVLDTYKESYTLSRLNKDNSIGIIIQKSSDANSVKTSDEVRKTLQELEKQYSYINLHFTIAQDITTFTRDSLKEVGRDLGLAILLVAIVLFLFLHNIKNSLIVLLAIPTSLFSAFILMNIFGFTINLITLMALTLVIGILVDDSIVVLENIHRHLELGEQPKEAAIKGRSEIGLAAIAITLVDVVVFLPIAMLSGVVGKIFREFGLTVVVSTLFSLFVSFTLTPLLASRWSRVVHFVKETLLVKFIRKFEALQDRISDKYRELLRWALNHKKTVVIVSFSLTILSITLIPFGLVGTEFMPQPDRGEFALNIEMPIGTSIEGTNEATRKVEDMIKDMPQVEQYYTIVGRSESSFGSADKSNIGQIQIRLVSEKKRKESTQEIISQVVEKASTIPGVKATASLIGIFGSADMTPVAIEIKGEELDKLIAVSKKVNEIVSSTAGTRDVKSSWEEGQPEVKVVINREKCADLGLTVGEVASTLRNALEGDNDTKYKDGDTEYDIRVVLSKQNRTNPEDVGKITIINRMGKQVQLNEIASINYGTGPTQIQRKDRSRIITIYSNLDLTRPLGEVIEEIQNKIKAQNFPPEISIFYGGEAEDMQNMFADMLLAISFAILFVYMIMVSLFESYIHPFTIMFSLPVALVGALFALAITGETLNIFSMIGVLLSMGLVTKNAILLVDYTNTLRSRGKSMIDALLEAGPIRLRPIIMTTATMVFGMLPLAVAAGAGGDFRRGLAIVVIGALLSSTMLTLVLVPVVYTIMESYRVKVPALFKKLNPIKKKAIQEA